MINEQFPGLSFSECGTHRLLYTEEPQNLKDSEDMVIPSATMKGLANFVRARKDAILARTHETNFLVETRMSQIALTVGEHGGRKGLSDTDRVTATIVVAKSDRTDDFNTVLRYVKKAHPNAHDLAMEFRKLPHLFENETEWARVVGELRNTNVKIQKIYKDTSVDAESREKRMLVEITEGKLDLLWHFYVPFFEGEERQYIPVRAIYEVCDGGNRVEIVLLSAGLVQQERDFLKDMLERTVQELENILGVNVIPMIYVDSAARAEQMTGKALNI